MVIKRKKYITSAGGGRWKNISRDFQLSDETKCFPFLTLIFLKLGDSENINKNKNKNIVEEGGTWGLGRELMQWIWAILNRPREKKKRETMNINEN